MAGLLLSLLSYNRYPPHIRLYHINITDNILKERPAPSCPLCPSAWRRGPASAWPGTPPTPGWGRWRRRRRRAACWPASSGGGTRRSGEPPWSRVSTGRRSSRRSCSLAHNRFRDLGLDCWTQSYEWRNINTELDSLSLFDQIFFNILVKSGQKCLNYG